VDALSSYARDLVSLLRSRSQQQPERLAYSYEREEGCVRLTYAELDRQARAVAARLQASRSVGERALLLYPPGPEFLAGFFGCLYAGVIAIPAYPPKLPVRPRDYNFRRILAIARDASPRFVLTTRAVLARVGESAAMLPGLQDAQWIASDAPEGPGADAWSLFTPAAEALAFLQYTSGSTGHPKGVMVSHAHILSNERMIAAAFGHSERTVVGGWLPVFHDMGLIGHVLQPLFLGVPCHLMSPVAFIKSPITWLKLISDYRITTSGAPDFAYRLCTASVSEEQKAKLDLSSWDLAFNGAEPVRHDTLEAFTAAFAACGFRRQAFYPTYGLAEATLFVSGGEKQAEPVLLPARRPELERGHFVPAEQGSQKEAVRVLVGCGRSARGQELRVVDPETRTPVPEGQVGEVWLAGPHVTGGYWQRPEQTAERFGAALAGTDAHVFYRTGDLALLWKGELFITGRASDLLIVRGVNHYPQDLELTVERVDERFLMPCAVSVEVEGEERVVVIQEVRRDFPVRETETVAAAVRQALAEAHGLELHALVLVRQSAMPRTSSGKVQRRVCRDLFLKGQLEALGRWVHGQPRPTAEAPVAPPPADTGAREALQSWLLERVARLLRVQPHEVDPQRHLSEYGLDSAASVLLAGELERKLGRSVPATVAWDHPTLAAIASFLTPSVAMPPPLAGPSSTTLPRLHED
jgi:acyl-CoA synthetase (AMP-forming)/AMP-acid ligase II/acyl carrier protein